MNLISISIALIVQMYSLPSLVEAEDGCVFKKHNQNKEQMASYQRLKPLFGKRYEVQDIDSDEYSYYVGLCTTAVSKQKDIDGVGVVQVVKQGDKLKSYNLGKYTDADIIAGTDWVYLEYLSGDPYNTHCNKENRRAVIMLTCDETRNDNNAKMILLEENSNKTAGCYYLFELSHKAVCPDNKNNYLSLGSIFIIVFVTVVAVYILLGFLYQRFVLGAKGMEQIPNYNFWQDFGNLEADGCNFLCRSGGNRGPRTYKGVGDDQLEDIVEEGDDHLLPM